MRVLHVVTAFPRSRSDVITPWLVRLLVGLRDRGVEAEVLAPAYRGSPDGVHEGIPVHRFRYAPAAIETLTHDQTVPDRLGERPWYAALLPLYLAGGTAAAWRAGRGGPDVVHVHWPLPHALFGAAARTASAGRTALVSSFYSVEIRWVERRMPWLRPFLRWSIRTSDAVTAISSATAEAVRALEDRPVRIVPFSAAVDAGDAVEGATRDGHVPLEGRELRLLFVGRLVERKGVEVLVRALPRILEERPARLTVVGEGSREAAIREAVRAAGVEDRVELTGYVPEERLRSLYATCDVFVLPAVVDARGDTEGLGVVLIEALRFGRPVVASDLGGIPDIVEPGRSGVRVPPGDPAALARAILELAANPEEARRLGGEGRELVERRFGWDRILDELEETYRTAIEVRGRAEGGRAAREGTERGGGVRDGADPGEAARDGADRGG